MSISILAAVAQRQRRRLQTPDDVSSNLTRRTGGDVNKLEFIKIASYTNTLMKQATEKIGEPIYDIEDCPFFSPLPGHEAHVVHWVFSRIFCDSPDPDATSWVCVLCGEIEGI